MTLYLLRLKDKSTGFLTADFGPPCAECGDVPEFLCDYPVGKEKTCDRPLCEFHANEVAPDIHYCPSHFQMWRKFERSGGVEKQLKNVVPYKRTEE